jgi:hypothetical protein
LSGKDNKLSFYLQARHFIFAGKLATVSDKININYLFGEEEMLKEDKKEKSQTVDIPPKETSMLIEIIHSQQKTIEMLAEKIVSDTAK